MRHTLRIKETGKVAYCIQPGTYMYDFVQQVRPTLSVGEADAWDALGDEKKSAIKLIMYFGYHNNKLPAGTYTVIEQDTSTTGFTAKGSKSGRVTESLMNQRYDRKRIC